MNLVNQGFLLAGFSRSYQGRKPGFNQGLPSILIPGAEQCRQANKDNVSEYSRLNNWKPVTRIEVRKFIALSALMGIYTAPAMPDYWTTNSFVRNPMYNAFMSRNRYQIISRFLHFNDNKNDGKNDRLFKIRPLLEYLINKFQEEKMPSQKISIDEQLILHKGRIGFRQYNPSKRARFGLKFFSLCDETGYLFNTELYTGKNTDQIIPEEEKHLGKSG